MYPLCYFTYKSSCTQHYDKYDIAQNSGTIPLEQKQLYDKYDIAQNSVTIPAEQKQHHDRYDIA